MDTIIVVIIIVAAVCIILLLVTLNFCWRRQHTDWLRREATRHSSEVVAKRLQMLNDKVEFQLSEALEHSFPRPYYNASQQNTTFTTASTDAVESAERAMQALISSCIRATLEAKDTIKAPRNTTEGGNTTSSSPQGGILSTLELLANIDACPELLHMCKVAVNNAYAAIGQIVQIEGCTVFDDVIVVRNVADDSVTLEQLQKREIEKATPHATCCCLPFCCTTRSTDKNRFKKNRTLFFMAAGTRFCSAVNILEPEEEAAQRMANTNESYNAGYGGERRRKEREKRRTKGQSVYEDEDHPEDIKQSNNTNRSGPKQSLYAPPMAPVGIPTAIDVPPALEAFDDGGSNSHKLLNMADAISRRMIKVSSYAKERSKVTITKIPQQPSSTEGLRAANEAHHNGPHTASVAVAPHPDLLSTIDTTKILSCMFNRRHHVNEKLLVPSGGWSANKTGSYSGAVKDLKPAVLKDLSSVFTKGLPLVSKSMDKEIFSCEGIRDDLIIFFANLRKVAQSLGSVRTYSSGGGKGLIVCPEVRSSFSMYNAIKLFDYQAKKWLVQVALIISCEAARAYYHASVLRTKELAAKAIKESKDRVAQRMANGQRLPPLLGETPEKHRETIDLFASPLHDVSADHKKTHHKNVPSEGNEEADGAEPNQNEVVPSIRVRSPKIDRVEQRLHTKIVSIIEAVHSAFMTLNLNKKETLAAFIINISEICALRRTSGPTAQPHSLLPRQQVSFVDKSIEFSKFHRTFVNALGDGDDPTINLEITEKNLRSAVVSPSLLMEVAADDACKHQARRGLLSLRERLVDMLCPPIPPSSPLSTLLPNTFSPETPIETRFESNTTPSGKPPAAPSRSALRSTKQSPTFTNRSSASVFSPIDLDDEELEIIDEVVGGDGNTHHNSSGSHPSALHPLKEAYCVYHQIPICAVRQILAPMEKLVSTTITDAEAQLAKMLLTSFAPKGKRMLTEWESLVAHIAFPILRRVSIKLYFFQHCATLAVIINSLLHHLNHSDSSVNQGNCAAIGNENDLRLLLAECCEDLEKSLRQLKGVFELEVSIDEKDEKDEEASSTPEAPDSSDIMAPLAATTDVVSEAILTSNGSPEALKVARTLISEIKPLLAANRFLPLTEVSTILGSGWAALGIDNVPAVLF